jgi:hypothetical protein
VISSAALHTSHVLLNRARLIAEAPAAQAGQIGSGGHPSSKAPPGAFTHSSSTLATFGDRMNRAIATGANIALVSANLRCANELDAIQHGQGVEPETKEQFRYRICTDYEGNGARFVADRERISEELVRKIRTEEGRDARGHLVAA